MVYVPPKQEGKKGKKDQKKTRCHVNDWPCFLLTSNVKCILVSLLFLDFFFLLYLERGERQERNIGHSPLACTPVEDRTHTQACTLTRNQPGSLLVVRTTPNQLTPSRLYGPGPSWFLRYKDVKKMCIVEWMKSGTIMEYDHLGALPRMSGL